MYDQRIVTICLTWYGVLRIAWQLLGVLDIATIAEKTGLALETVQELV